MTSVEAILMAIAITDPALLAQVRGLETSMGLH